MDDQDLRKHWHDLNNRLNVLVTQTGFVSLMHRDHYYDSLEGDALKTEFFKLLDQMSKLESESLKAGELSKLLKQEIYRRLNIDSSIKNKNQ